MIIRPATMDDREPIKQLIAESARLLSREHYNDMQIEAAIASVAITAWLEFAFMA